MNERITFSRFIIGLPLLVLLVLSEHSWGQPLWNSKQMVDGFVVFQDIKAKNKYYFGPHHLKLSQDAAGKPIFQLLSMRYTGTQLTGDKTEKRFSNLLQFAVTMPPVSAENIKSMSEKLKLPPNAKLLPIPIRNMEATIISGVGEGISGDRLVKRATLESEISNGKGVFWTERNFVMPLDNAEAQILADQFKNGRIAVSLNYTFYADVLSITEEEVKISGDSAFVEQMKSAIDEIERDTVESLEAIASGVLDIGIDAALYPGALKQIDLNANSVPPAYPAVEVKCFDFSLDSRPDLAYKRVFVEGISLNGQAVQEKIKFSKGERDVSSRFVYFKYAIRMDRPLRYKVIEGATDGEESTANWITMPQFSNLIDASTTQQKSPVEQHCVEVEVLQEYLEEKQIAAVKVYFTYALHAKQLSQTIDFKATDNTLLKSMCITHDKNSPIRYFVTRKDNSGASTKGYLKNFPIDGYILVGK